MRSETNSAGSNSISVGNTPDITNIITNSSFKVVMFLLALIRGVTYSGGFVGNKKRQGGITITTFAVLRMVTFLSNGLW